MEARAEPLGEAFERPVDQPVKKTAVKPWAVVGALCLIFYTFIMVKWVTGPYFEAVPSGPTEVPTWMKTFYRIYIPLGILAMFFVFYWFLVRPWRKERRLTTDGMFVIMWFIVMWFHDPIANYFNHWYTYNASIPNFGSWTADVPGWHAPAEPGAMVVEPFLFVTPAYVYALFTIPIAANWLMRKAKARWPNLGTLGLLGICYVFMVVLDFTLESFWLRTGFYTYAGAHDSWSIFDDHYYKFPIYESLIWGMCWTGFAALRYFKNDKGETLVERGIDQVRASRKQKTGLRFLAIVGAGSAIYLLLYNVPIQFFAARAESWPKDVQERSYLTMHLCGPGTDRGCPGKNVPIPRRDSAYLDKSGNLVVPEGVAPPGSETLENFRRFKGGPEVVDPLSFREAGPRRSTVDRRSAFRLRAKARSLERRSSNEKRRP